jgi:uncharacterized damage-inducible protein DinB
MGMNRDTYLGHLMLEYGRTRHYLGTFRNEDLAFRPTPATRSVGEWALHLMGCHKFLLHAGAHNDTDTANFKVSHELKSIGQSVALFDDYYRALRDGLRPLSDETFNRTIHVFGRDMTFSDLALEILIHEGHHRGQLGLALRLIGREPPDIYMSTPPLVE